MYSTNAFVIREATEADADTLRILAELDSQRPLEGRALIGEINEIPAAAVSIADGRIVSDPFRVTTHLVPLLGLRARSLRSYERTPSLTERLRAVMGGWRPATRLA